MATLTINCPTDAGAFLRQLGRRLHDLAGDIPDHTPTGGTIVLTIDNAPASGNTVSVQITSGPYQTKKSHS